MNDVIDVLILGIAAITMIVLLRELALWWIEDIAR